MKKLHFACGDVFLKGYTNIDIIGDLSSQVDNNQNITTLDEYYRRPFGAKPKKAIVDKTMDLRDDYGWLSYKNNSIDEIIIIAAIEHFTEEEANKIIDQFYRILKPGGKLIIDFPDIERILKEYNDRPEFMIRLIYGSQKNDYAFHKWGYTKETFKKLLGNRWKSIQYKDIVAHDYPEIGVEAIK